MMRRQLTFRILAVVASAFVVMALADKAAAVDYRLERIASGLNQPTYVTQAPDDPANILYFTERTKDANPGFGASNQMGKVWRYDVTTRTKTLVLDLSSRSVTQDTGLQTIAFHPDFNNSAAPGYGKMYVSSSRPSGTALNTVEEYTVDLSGATPSYAASFSKTVLQYQNNAQLNHTIDWVGFDPTAVGDARNYLYISTGDGSYGNSYNDGTSPTGRPSQNPSDPAGKMLRVDVAGPDAYPADPNKNFAIPASNPIPTYNAAHPGAPLMGSIRVAGVPTPAPALGEVYLTGLRNTYRASFDRANGDLWMGDVGENFAEEVSFLKAGSNANGPPVDYGWPQREATFGSGISGAPQTTTNVFTGAPSLEPLQQFVHDGGGEAVIGGYVYHGPVSELQGTYFYTDFVGTSAGAQIWSLNFDRNTSTGSYDGNNGTNTDVSALWQSLVYDPTDPTYTPDSTTGSSRGLDHIVSFGEDNAGNLYLVDFGNGSGFDGQYPAAGLGEIFKVVPTLAIKVTVDRVTGAMTFANAAGAPVDVRGYSISSTTGAISSGDLTPITDRLDAPPGGDGSIDPTNDWQITSTPGDHALFSEASTGGAASLSTAESFELSPAGGWLKSIYEDLDLQVTLNDGSVVAGIVDYTGNGGSPWARSDLNFNGQLDPGDWTIFRTHHLQDMSGLSLAQSYQLGDLNGDGVNDFTDFRMFQADYTAENGAAAFAALLKVPEPSTLALLVLGCTAVFVRRTSRGHRRPAERDGRFQLAHVRNRLSHVSILSVLAVATVLHLRANAEIRNRYSFAEGPTADASGRTIVDSISGANGVVRGSGSTATAGELVLPGGSSASRAYVDLPNGMISSLTDATFEAWYTMTTARSWGRIFDFGSTAGGELTGPGGGGEGQDYIFYAASRGTDQNTQRAGMRNLDPAFGGSDAGTVGTGEAPQMDPNLGYTLGTQRHVAVVFDSTGGSAPGLASVALYIDGVPAPGVVNPADTPFQLGNLNDVNNWLGRSNWTGDSNFEGSFNEFRIYDNALTAEDVLADFNAGPDTLPAPPNFLNLQVNTRTGAVTIMNNVPSSPIDLDYYRITSPSGALNLAGWNSLDSQDVDAIGAGEGESWDETGAANASQLAELYLLGHSTATTAHELSLGKAYDPSFFPPGADGDLIFQYGVVGKNNLVTGTITYFTPPPLLGDYNDDGTVDAADYTVWRDHLNTAYQLPNETTGVTPGNVTIEDYQQWKLHFGETLAGSGSAGVAVAVPEPTAALLWAVAVVVPSVIGTRSGRS